MKAIRIHGRGGPERLVYEDMPPRDKGAFQVDAASRERTALGHDRWRCGWNGAPRRDAEHPRRDEPGTITSPARQHPGSPHVRTDPSTGADRRPTRGHLEAACRPKIKRLWPPARGGPVGVDALRLRHRKKEQLP